MAEEARAWVGWRLDELKGSRAGHIEDVYADALDGEPRWLGARMGRFGHLTAIPVTLAAAGMRRVWAPFTREAMRAAPRLERGEPLTRELELELCRHFGIPLGEGRPEELASRARGAQTALPVTDGE